MIQAIITTAAIAGLLVWKINKWIEEDNREAITRQRENQDF
jgi:hypothetical protein